MRGEPFILNNIILKHEDNPIKKAIGKNSPERIIEVIEDEFWKEFKRRLDFSTNPTLVIRGFGKFITRYSPLKGYIRRSIRKIRKLRIRIARLKEKKDFDPENSMTVLIERQLVLKVRAALSQLNQMRISRIMRIIVWNEKQRRLGTPEKIKVDYAVLEWSFKDYLLNNGNYYKKLKLSK